MLTRELLKQVRQIEIKTRGIVNQVFSGEYHSVFKGRGMEFSEVREYQFGDDIRNIDWNVTARFGEPYVKIFEEERELSVVLMVDLSGSLIYGSTGKTKQQIAAEISAILAFSALKNNDKVGLIAFTDKIELFIPPRKGKKHILRIIRELLNFQPEGKGTDIKGALEYMNNAIKRRGIVFLLSDFFDSGYEKILGIVGKKHDFVAVTMSDPGEYVLPDVGLVKLKDSETGQERFIDTSDKNFRKLYYAQRMESQSELKKILRKNKLDSVSINTAESYIKPLIDFFRLRERRW